MYLRALFDPELDEWELGGTSFGRGCPIGYDVWKKITKGYKH